MNFLDLDDNYDLDSIEMKNADVSICNASRCTALKVSFEMQGSDRYIKLKGLSQFDLSKFAWLAMDIENCGSEPIVVTSFINDERWIDGAVYLGEHQQETLWILLKRNKIPGHLEKYFSPMMGLPGNHVGHWVSVDFTKVSSVSIVGNKKTRGQTIRISNIRCIDDYNPPSVNELESSFFPFVDTYGQYIHKDWPNKVYSQTDIIKQKEHENKDFQRYPGPHSWNKYGGWKNGPQLKAMGHFYVEKHEGKWWLIDPEGKLFWSHGVNCVRHWDSTFVDDHRLRYFENFPFDDNNMLQFCNKEIQEYDFSGVNLFRKYGELWEDVTTEHIHKRLRSWGLNTIGNWSQESIYLGQKTPYTVAIEYKRPHSESMRYPDGFDHDLLNVNDISFRTLLRQRLALEAQTSARDPFCIGYFIDNEIRWPDSDYEKKADAYYRICREELKSFAPDKLYLGSRNNFSYFPDSQKEIEITRAAAKYCDVISLNRYGFTLSDFKMPNDINRPLIISEFHFGALDRGLLHSGFRTVKDQNQRSIAYKNYLSEMLENPFIVGAHWFQYRDQMVTGRFDGENCQVGFVDICDTPYPETIEACREIGYKLYNYRTWKTSQKIIEISKHNLAGARKKIEINKYTDKLTKNSKV